MQEEGAYYKGFMVGDGSWHLTGKPPMPMLRIFKKKLVCVDRLIASSDEIPSDPPSKFSKIKREHLFLYPQTASDKKASKGEGVHRFGGMYRTKKTIQPYLTTYRTQFPDFMMDWDKQTKLDFLAGLFDSDGSGYINDSGRIYYIVTSSNLDFLDNVQRFFATLGFVTKFQTNHDKPVEVTIRGYKTISNALYGVRLTIGDSGELSKQIKFTRLPHWTPEIHAAFEEWCLSRKDGELFRYSDRGRS